MGRVMPPRKKQTSDQGIKSLVGKEIEYIDCRDETVKLGKLCCVDDLGWIGIENKHGRVVYFHVTRLDAISEVRSDPK